MFATNLLMDWRVIWSHVEDNFNAYAKYLSFITTRAQRESSSERHFSLSYFLLYRGKCPCKRRENNKFKRRVERSWKNVAAAKRSAAAQPIAPNTHVALSDASP